MTDAELDALRQERDAALADARRYRWLRSAKTGKPISCVTTGSAWRCTLNTVELDAAIDAARAEAEALRHDVERHVAIAADQATDIEALRAVAQAALEALDEAQSYTSCASWSPSMTRQCFVVAEQLRAALAGEKK